MLEYNRMRKGGADQQSQLRIVLRTNLLNDKIITKSVLFRQSVCDLVMHVGPTLLNTIIVFTW